MTLIFALLVLQFLVAIVPPWQVKRWKMSVSESPSRSDSEL